MQPSSPAHFELLISKPRLGSYRGYFQATLPEAVGLYMWNCELSACFGSLLSILEVVLRNSIHRAMSQEIGGLDSAHWYDSRRANLTPYYLGKIAEIRAKRPGASPGEIVSGLNFGFWPAAMKLIGAPGRVIPQIFPHHQLTASPNGWSSAADRKKMLAFMHEVNTFRNRLAHHEPLWKFGALPDLSAPQPRRGQPPVLLFSDSLNLADSLVRLNRMVDHLDTAFSSIDVTFHNEIVESSWRRKLDFLLSIRGVERYRTLRHVPSRGHRTPAEFRDSFSLLVRSNRPQYVMNSKGGGLFTPD